MRKLSISVLSLLCVALLVHFCVSPTTVQGEQRPMPHLRPIDPRPLEIPNADFSQTQTLPDGAITPKRWTLEGDGFWKQEEQTQENSLHLCPNSRWIGDPISLESGLFYQLQARYHGEPQDRQYLVCGFDFANTVFDTAYYGRNKPNGIMLSSFFQVPYDTSEAEIRLGLDSYQVLIRSGTLRRSRPSDEKTIRFEHVKLLPARCVYQGIRKNEPLRDIYWGKEIGVKRIPPPGEFLLLGQHESLDSFDKTKPTRYHLEALRQDYDMRAAKTLPNPPAVSIHRRPIIKSRLYRQAQFNSNSWTFDKSSEIIFRFDFPPVRVDEKETYTYTNPIPILSAKLWFTYNGLGASSENRDSWSEIEYGDDGRSWKTLKNSAPYREHHEFRAEWPKSFFPKNQLYLRLRIPDNVKERFEQVEVRQFRFDAELETEDYQGIGRQTFYSVSPGTEKWDAPTKIWPLFCSENQMYYLYRNESEEPVVPKIGGKHDYVYYGPEGPRPQDAAAPNPEFSPSWRSQPRSAQYEIFSNDSVEINDLIFHWEVLGSEDGTIPPKSERVVVFTLETKRLRASSHQQFGPYIHDAMDVEFQLGPYNLSAPGVRFFPPRLMIE